MPQMPTTVDPEIFRKVQACFCDALELDTDEVHWDSKVFDDLDAESIDLLDVVFQIESAFDIQIPRGGMEAQAKDVDGVPGEIDGRLTIAGRDKLREMMPEVPPEEIVEGMKSSEIGLTFRVGTFVNIVIALLKEK